MLRDVVRTSGTNAIIVLAGLGTGVLAARLLGAEERGLLAVLLFWPQLILSVGGVSLTTAAVRRRHVTAVPAEVFVVTCVCLAALVGIAVAAVGVATLPTLLGHERSAMVGTASAYLIGYVVLGSIGLMLLALDQAERRFGRYNLLRTLPSACYLMLIIAISFLGEANAVSFTWASLTGTALIPIILIAARRGQLAAALSVGEAKRLVQQGIMFHGASLVMLATAAADRVVVMRLFDDAAVGLYVVAMTVATAAQGIVTQSVPTVVLPHLAGERDRAEATRLLAATVRRVAGFMLACCVPLAIAIPWAVPFIFGNAFAAATPAAVVLVFAAVPLTLRQTVVQLTRAFGDARTGLVAEGCALGAFLMLAFALGSSGGIVAIAGAQLIASILALGVVALLIRRCYGVGPAEWLIPDRQVVVETWRIARGVRALRWS